MEKKNQIPKYPHLRFPEFTDEWKEVTLGEVTCERNETNTPTLPLLSITANKGVIPQTDSEKKDVSNADKSKYKRICSGDIGYNTMRMWQGRSALSFVEGIVSPAYTIVTPLKGVSPLFLSYLIKRPRLIYEFWTHSQGLVEDTLNCKYKDFAQITITIPSLSEQRKIAALLSLIDERIEVQNAISNDLESLIVGFYNSVQYVTKAGWHKVRLRDLLTIRKEQNTSGSYEVYSVSVSRGIINQIVHLGRSFAAANTSNYGVVHPGDLVYTKSPTGQFPFGIVKQNHNASPVAVSPLYGVYRPISPEVGTLLHYFFLSPLRANNYLAPLIQKGAKNTINIRTDHFLDNVVLLPKDEKELRCIADCLLALDERLSVEREYVELLKQQKAYLLRQMFI